MVEEKGGFVRGKGIKIYFAGSITGNKENNIFFELIDYLKEFGDVLDESAGWVGGDVKMERKEIYERDLKWLKESDVLVAEVSTPSHGVGFEIAIAKKLGKRVLCLAKSDKIISAIIEGSGLNVRKYKDTQEAKQIISEFMNIKDIKKANGKLIVFEGTDCSGKSTQIKLLMDKLGKEGKTTATLDFPNYSTPTGKIVRRYLDNEFGSANEIPAKVASIFFAEDRFAAKPIVDESMKNMDVTILDRYVESNMGHQGGKVRDKEKREEFFEWLRQLEYGNFKLNKPDAVVFLYMPPKVSAELMKDRIRKSEFHPGAEKLDGHEGNEEHMKNAAESYLHLAELYGWIMINCAPDGTINSLKTPEQIHDEIYEKLKMIFEYSRDDLKVLNYFFTNSFDKVFVSKNFHPEVWALMQGRYSRSKEGLRESFLQLLKEEPENYKMLVEEIDKTFGGQATKHATEKAIKFMEKWVLGYGHSSIAEGAVINIGIEGLSILATKVIEDNRLSSFCEKSTRYVSFNNSSFYIDEDLKNSEFFTEIRELLDYLFKTYENLHEPVLNYIKKAVPLQLGINSVAWERACAARRFDAIRYLLPTCTKTSLGWTVNARQLAHGISKLLSSPLKEMNELGEEIKKESSKVLPSLLKFADKSNYFIKTEREMLEFAKMIEVSNGNDERVKLVNGPENENHIIASILYRYKNQQFSEILEKVKLMSSDEKEAVFDAYLSNMGNFDQPMRELEHEDLCFDIIIDYGAFRDLQRHRICTQTNQLFNSDLGYDVPKDIANAGCEEEYRKAMNKAKEVFEKVRKKYPLQAQYILPLGYKKRFLITMNLREIYHLIKLRTIPLAHDSYRRIAYRVYEIMKEKYPLLSKYIVCNYSQEELGRLKAEEQTEKKRSVSDW